MTSQGLWGGGGAGQGEARRRSSPSPEKPCGLRYIPVWGGASPGPSHNLPLPAHPTASRDRSRSLLPTHLWPPDNSLLANSRRTPWSPRSGEHGLWGSRGGRALGPGEAQHAVLMVHMGPWPQRTRPAAWCCASGPCSQRAPPPAPGMGAWGLRTCSQRYGDMETECPPDARRPHPQPTRKGRGCRRAVTPQQTASPSPQLEKQAGWGRSLGGVPESRGPRAQWELRAGSQGAPTSPLGPGRVCPDTPD